MTSPIPNTLSAPLDPFLSEVSCMRPGSAPPGPSLAAASAAQPASLVPAGDYVLSPLHAPQEPSPAAAPSSCPLLPSHAAKLLPSPRSVLPEPSPHSGERGRHLETHRAMSAEREALMGRVAIEEAAQQEAARSAAQAEDRLARLQAELDASQMRVPAHHTHFDLVDSASSPRLRDQLHATKAKCEVRELRIGDCEAGLRRWGQALGALKSEREALVSMHGSLRSELLAAEQASGSRFSELRIMQANLSDLQRQGTGHGALRRSEANLQADHLQSLTRDVWEKQEQYEVAQRMLQSTQRTLAEQRVALNVAKHFKHDLLKAQQNMASLQSQAVRDISSRADRIATEKQHLEDQLRVAELELSRARSLEAEHDVQTKLVLNQAWQQLDQETREAQAASAALGIRIEAAAVQLQDERLRGQRLCHELSASKAAAGMEPEMRTTPLRSPKCEPELRATPVWSQSASQRTSSSPPAQCRGSSGRSCGWVTTRNRLQEEVAKLQRWKGEAKGSVQRMSDGLRVARQGYEQQVQYGLQLEAAISRIGQRAQLLTCPPVASLPTESPGPVTDHSEQSAGHALDSSSRARAFLAAEGYGPAYPRSTDEDSPRWCTRPLSGNNETLQPRQKSAWPSAIGSSCQSCGGVSHRAASACGPTRSLSVPRAPRRPLARRASVGKGSRVSAKLIC